MTDLVTTRLVLFCAAGEGRDMEDVARLVKEAMVDQQMSVRDVEAASERHGARVSYSTVSRITKGTYSPGEKVLQGLSVALGIPIERLRAAAKISDPGTPFRLPDYASRLSASERSAVEHLVRVMVDAKNERSANPPAPTSESYSDVPLDPSRLGLAARERGDDDPDDEQLPE